MTGQQLTPAQESLLVWVSKLRSQVAPAADGGTMVCWLAAGGIGPPEQVRASDVIALHDLGLIRPVRGAGPATRWERVIQ